jgi:hypothetical protein
MTPFSIGFVLESKLCTDGPRSLFLAKQDDLYVRVQ